MGGDVESIGAAITAGLASSAVEPQHGGRGALPEGMRCLNCGTSLVGSHCHHCGQKVDIHRSFGAIGHDLVHSIFHFEGKLWNTLPLLAWQPGDLTRRFIHGERARFISPLALFLFAVFLTYAVIATISGTSYGFDFKKAATEQAEVRVVSARLASQLDAIDRELAAPDTPEPKRRLLTGERRALLSSAKMLGLVDEGAGPEHVRVVVHRQSSLYDMRTGIPFIDHGIEKARDNPGLLLYKLQANAYKFAWALIPLSLPFLWLLFPFSRRFHTYDHFVFITYSLSYMLLMFVVVRLLNLTIFGGIATFLSTLYVPVHMYRQIRGAYRASPVGALFRTVLLVFFCLFAVVIFMLLLLTLGTMG